LAVEERFESVVLVMCEVMMAFGVRCKGGIVRNLSEDEIERRFGGEPINERGEGR